MDFYIGCHLSSAKGYMAMGKEAVKLGCNVFQFFTRNPRGGSVKPLDLADLENYNAFHQENHFGTLLAHVRRGDIVSVHSLRRGAAEAIEAIAHGDSKSSKVIGRSIGEINLPPGTTIGAIIRDEEVLIAHDSTVINAGDHVILFLVDKKHIRDVEKLFHVGLSFF